MANAHLWPTLLVCKDLRKMLYKVTPYTVQIIYTYISFELANSL